MREIDEDGESLLERWRPSLAFNIGAMGTDDRNFYRESYVRAGYAEAAAEVYRLWKARDREGAARAGSLCARRGGTAREAAGRDRPRVRDL